MNLISLIDAKNQLDPRVFEKYKKAHHVSLKDYEMESLAKMMGNFIKIGNYVKYFSHFSIGYNIQQIGKEFDLFRLGNNYHINIELKSRYTTSEKIGKQLCKNAYYFRPIQESTYLFTYIEDKNCFFMLEDESLHEIAYQDVLQIIKQQEVDLNQDVRQMLDNYFEPTHYLVSPFNETNVFMDDAYFLTAQQDEIKKEIIEKYIDYPRNISIKGAPGTGKTLLIYDIAKEQMKKGKNVLVVHCGYLNEGHSTLNNEYGWNVCGVKQMRLMYRTNIDLIVTDESQRIKLDQYDSIIKFCKERNIACIFSHDGAQCLHNNEIFREMEQRIIDEADVTFRLKGKVRSNEEMAMFIKCFFNVNTDKKAFNFKEILHFKYFTAMETAKEYAVRLSEYDWKFINFTNSIHNVDPFDDVLMDHIDDNAHRVVGQEFEKVGVIIDRNFWYNNGRLEGTNRFYYHSTKMLFQILTRTKKSLYFLIVNNENILDNLMMLMEDE